MSEKEKCYKCGVMAVWLYLPGEKDDFFCEKCVPRECDCNYNYLHHDGAPTFEDRPYKWITDKIWIHLDENNKPYPCCEYCYEAEGFDIEYATD